MFERKLKKKNRFLDIFYVFNEKFTIKNQKLIRIFLIRNLRLKLSLMFYREFSNENNVYLYE